MSEDQESKHNFDDLLLEKIIAQIEELGDRLDRMEATPSAPKASAPSLPIMPAGNLPAQLAALNAKIDAVNARAASMRIDRQARLIIARIIAKIKRTLQSTPAPLAPTTPPKTKKKS